MVLPALGKALEKPARFHEYEPSRPACNSVRCFRPLSEAMLEAVTFVRECHRLESSSAMVLPSLGNVRQSVVMEKDRGGVRSGDNERRLPNSGTFLRKASTVASRNSVVLLLDAGLLG
jgi:hypothetical protein